MKNLKILFALIVSALLSISSCNQPKTATQEDREAITNLITVQFKQAWDVNDEAAMALMFLEDADLVFPTSPWIKGREAIQNAFSWDHPDGLTGTFNIEDIRFVDASTALVNVNAHFSGGKDNEGNPIPDNWDSATTFLKKQDGSWKYAALRVMPARMNYEEVKANIQDTWNQFISHWEQGNAEAAANCFTADAINMVPGSKSNMGREEIRTLLENFASGNVVKNAHATTLELDVIGSKAFEYGLYEDTIEPKKGKAFDRKIRYYAVWQLEPDGVWRWSRFIMNEIEG